MDDDAMPDETPPSRPAVRVGDAERDEAVTLLQQHLTDGRLDNDEFDERIAAALRARTRADLDVLFTDLPGRRPGQEVATPGATAAAPPASAGEPTRRTPIWAHWALIPIAVLLTAGVHGAGMLIPIVAMWVFWIYPAYVAPKRRTPTTTLTAADLTQEQRREVTALVNRGEKIAAIKRYRELTGADLVSAKSAVDTWQHQLER